MTAAFQWVDDSQPANVKADWAGANLPATRNPPDRRLPSSNWLFTLVVALVEDVSSGRTVSQEIQDVFNGHSRALNHWFTGHDLWTTRYPF